MYWVPLITGVLNGVFILDLFVTLATGQSIASIIVDASHNSVAEAIVANIPTDPVVFWLLAGFILVFVCAIECLLIYLSFYADIQGRGRMGRGLRWTRRGSPSGCCSSWHPYG